MYILYKIREGLNTKNQTNQTTFIITTTYSLTNCKDNNEKANFQRIHLNFLLKANWNGMTQIGKWGTVFCKCGYFINHKNKEFYQNN